PGLALRHLPHRTRPGRQWTKTPPRETLVRHVCFAAFCCLEDRPIQPQGIPQEHPPSSRGHKTTTDTGPLDDQVDDMNADGTRGLRCIQVLLATPQVALRQSFS